MDNNLNKKGELLVEIYPELVEEWHPTKNPELDLNKLMPNTRGKAWWKCKNQHEWETHISSRGRGVGKCPYCRDKKVFPGYNDLYTKHPELATQLHPTKNKNLDPRQILYSSGERVWWLGTCGHEWDALVRNRTKLGTGCPICAGKQILVGFNDLASVNPELAKEWSSRNTKTAQEVTISNGKEHWWICDQGHEWKVSPAKRNRGDGCPYCSNHRLLPGFNDLATKSPELAAQWSAKNKQRATEISGNNGNKVFWECELGHEWLSSVDDRARGNGCPICANKSVLTGYNDLATLLPDLMREWHPKNTLNPEKITVGSSKKAWWVCDQGHEWKAVISSRSKGIGCPNCKKLVSRAEEELAEWVKELLPNEEVLTSVRSVISPKELDIYIPSKNIAIEFNGLYWHSEAVMDDKTYHYSKWKACQEKGIQLIQIWEDDWRDNKNLIKRMLAAKLGLSRQKKVFARKTKIVKLDTKQARSFLEENHIQGYASGSYYLGLVQNEIIYAVMVLKKQGEDLLLSRYATSAQVVGGHSKLLKWAERNLEYRNMITFADLEVSKGDLYSSTGFIEDKLLKPDYKYLYQGYRWHKFGFRLERFRKDDAFVYEEGLSESQLARINKIHRIWDSGKIRYIKPRPIYDILDKQHGAREREGKHK